MEEMKNKRNTSIINDEIEEFNFQLEKYSNYIKIQSLKLENYFAKTEDIEKSMLELNNFKNFIDSIQTELQNEKSSLFEKLNKLDLTVSEELKNEINTNLSKKYNQFQQILNNLYNYLPIINSPCQKNLIDLKKDSDSSFLTEEEEAIKIISERIKTLKQKISLKQGTSKSSKKSKNNNRNYSSSEDTDTKELLHLNEQIKVLKSKMLAKGSQLNKVKLNSNNNTMEYNENFQKSQPSCSGPIYLPINHINRRNDSSNKNVSFEIEPLEIKEKPNSKISEHEISISKITCFPKLKYTSKIDIPPEQLELIKNNGNKRSINLKLEPISSRSKSMSISSSNTSEEKVKNPKYKRNKSAVHFANSQNDVIGNELNERNTLDNNHKDLCIDNETMTDLKLNDEKEIQELRNSLEKSKKEIEELKLELTNKNDQLCKQLEECNYKMEKNSDQILMNYANNEKLTKLFEDQNNILVNMQKKFTSENYEVTKDLNFTKSDENKNPIQDLKDKENEIPYCKNNNIKDTFVQTESISKSKSCPQGSETIEKNHEMQEQLLLCNIPGILF